MDLAQKINILKSQELFNDLTSKELETIAQSFNQKDVLAKTTFIAQDEDSDFGYLVFKGAVRVYRMSENGEEINVAILGPGEFIGEISLLDDKQRSANVEAISDTRLLVLSRGDFSKILKNYPEMAMKLIQLLAKRVRLADKYLEEVISKDLKGRVFDSLEILSNYFPDSKITLSHEEIASIVGATRPRVTEVLEELEKEGKISLSYRNISLI